MKKMKALLLLLSSISLVSGCSVSVSQKPALNSLVSAKTPAKRGSMLLVIEEIHVRSKTPLQGETVANPSTDFRDRFISALRDAKLFYDVYTSIPTDTSHDKVVRLNLKVYEKTPFWAFLNTFHQNMECSIELPDATVHVYKTHATGRSFSNLYVVAGKVTESNLKSITAQLRADSGLIEAVR